MVAVEVIRDEIIQEIFGLAFFIHRDREVAIEVIVDAFVRIPLVQDIQDERPEANKLQPYKLRIPEDLLPHYCLYLASDRWERDQEKAKPNKTPIYRPDDADYLIRYIKFLVWQTMERNSRYVAVALGCLLHTYGPTQISGLSPAFFNANNIRNTKKWLADRVRARFDGMNIVNPDNAQIISRPPIDGERLLVRQALEIFSDNNHIQPQTFILDTVFADGSSHTERERIHAVACPVCCGLSKLIQEWNDLFETTSRYRLADPETKLRVPAFTDALTDPIDRLSRRPLSDVELSGIKLKLYEELFRRKSARPGRLRLCVDGKSKLSLGGKYKSFSDYSPRTEIREYSPRTETEVPEFCVGEEFLDALPGRRLSLFTLPSTFAYIEIFGEDERGDVLLAVFPLLGSYTTEDEVSHWSVTMECGLKIELFISADDCGDGERICAAQLWPVGTESHLAENQLAQAVSDYAWMLKSFLRSEG